METAQANFSAHNNWDERCSWPSEAAHYCKLLSNFRDVNVKDWILSYLRIIHHFQAFCLAAWAAWQHKGLHIFMVKVRVPGDATRDCISDPVQGQETQQPF